MPVQNENVFPFTLCQLQNPMAIDRETLSIVQFLRLIDRDEICQYLHPISF